MVTLCVNIDHVATVRQARGAQYPDPVEAAHYCLQGGATGITIHLREDRRHIQDRDLIELRRAYPDTMLNLEMAATDEMLQIALHEKPDQVTLVPEKRQELTTEGGLDIAGQLTRITDIVKKLQNADIPVSLFIDPDEKQIRASKESTAQIIELHTGSYCNAREGEDQNQELQLLVNATALAREIGLIVNAGHGLCMDNVAPVAAIQDINELNIGHSIVSRAVMVGMEKATREMADLLSNITA
jgi:pyridoxine 5-phosphate synthase